MVFVRQKRCCPIMAATLCREVSRNVPMAGGTVAAISAISSSPITPGPLGMRETRPSADAPPSTARAASSMLLMQQIFTRGVRVGFTRLLAVGNPNILCLRSVLEKPAALGQPGVKPVDGATFIGPYLLQIANRHRLGGRSAGFITE